MSSLKRGPWPCREYRIAVPADCGNRMGTRYYAFRGCLAPPALELVLFVLLEGTEDADARVAIVPVDDTIPDLIGLHIEV